MAAMTPARSLPASVGRYKKPRPEGFGPVSTTPTRSSSRSLFVRSVRDSPGAPAAISVKLVLPRSRFRRMIGVHRSARISDALAIGQY
jgi:hypothetical protein